MWFSVQVFKNFPLSVIDCYFDSTWTKNTHCDSVTLNLLRFSLWFQDILCVPHSYVIWVIKKNVYAAVVGEEVCKY